MEHSVEIRDVWKMFRIYHERRDSLKDILSGRGRTAYEEFWSLREINLDIPKGQTIGIIGENGSGKSTLLKCITGILRPNKGAIAVDGKISALLELGAGFEPNLTGRENIYLNGSILQMTRKQIDAKVDSIIAFSELERFIDTPVKNYSSGMHMRLGFAIAINVNPDVLLIDEVLAVGDEAFQSKCYDAVIDIKNRGKTIILVTHDLEAVRKFCDSAVWLDGGRLMREGSTGDVIDAYRVEVHKKEREKMLQGVDEILPRGNRYGSGEARVTKLEMLDKNGQSVRGFDLGEPVKVVMDYEARPDLGELIFGVSIFAKDGTYCFGTNTGVDGLTISSSKGKGTVTLVFESLPLMAGTYLLDIGLFDQNAKHPYDYLSRTFDFKVRGGKKGESGFFHLNHEWEVS
ncbi:MAG: ABC transporter ATP-binding protein [Actinomycetota bacterium]